MIQVVPRRSPIPAGLLLLLALAACGDGNGDTDAPMVITLSGDGIADTVASYVTAPLVARVTRGGRPVPDIFVIFEGSLCGLDPCVYVGPANSQLVAATLLGRTDEHGTMTAHVRLGYYPGPADVVVNFADSAGVSDTAHYEVQPGSTNAP